jgi:hypothetical protein
MLQSAPNSSYQEGPISSVPTGVLYAEAVSAAKQLRSEVADARKLAQVLSSGWDLLLSNTCDNDRTVHLAMELVSVDQQATLAIGDVELMAGDSGILRIRALPGSQRLPRGRPSVPEHAPAHQSPAARFRVDLTRQSGRHDRAGERDLHPGKRLTGVPGHISNGAACWVGGGASTVAWSSATCPDSIQLDPGLATCLGATADLGPQGRGSQRVGQFPPAR